MLHVSFMISKFIPLPTTCISRNTYRAEDESLLALLSLKLISNQTTWSEWSRAEREDGVHFYRLILWMGQTRSLNENQISSNDTFVLMNEFIHLVTITRLTRIAEDNEVEGWKVNDAHIRLMWNFGAVNSKLADRCCQRWSEEDYIDSCFSPFFHRKTAIEWRARRWKQSERNFFHSSQTMLKKFPTHFHNLFN